MKVIKSVLKEELANSLAMKKDFERELAKLPKGPIVKKIIRCHEYITLLLAGYKHSNLGVSDRCYARSRKFEYP